jgi:hypothetical protein
MALVDLLTQTADVYRKVETASATGAQTSTWTKVTGSLTCAVQMNGGGLGENAGAIRTSNGFAVYCLPGVSLFPEDAVVTDGPTGALQTPDGPAVFYIESGPIDEAGRGVLWVYRGTRTGGMRDFV